jgi:outer membrane protein OmpA-like peptidoglycan-associated protein
MKRFNSVLAGCVTVAGLSLVAGCSSLPYGDRDPEAGHYMGYYVDPSDAHARGGIGTYVPRVAARDRDSSSDRAERPSDDQLSHSQASPQARASSSSQIVAPTAKIHFELGKADINEDSRKELSRFISSFDRKEPIRIEGYADHLGDTAFNRDLSRRRAEAVRDYLVRQGLDRSSIRVKAFGESKADGGRNSPSPEWRSALILPQSQMAGHGESEGNR